MEKMLNIGVVVKPQGIKGELKVVPYTDDLTRFKKLKEVIIDGAVYRVLGAKIASDAVFLALENINDRNTAETFRGKLLFVNRKDAIVPKKDSYFIVDIVGCEIITESGEKIGTVTEVTSAKTDIFTIDCNGKTARFPFLKDMLINVDTENKNITVKEKRLKEILCYED